MKRSASSRKTDLRRLEFSEARDHSRDKELYREDFAGDADPTICEHSWKEIRVVRPAAGLEYRRCDLCSTVESYPAHDPRRRERPICVFQGCELRTGDETGLCSYHEMLTDTGRRTKPSDAIPRAEVNGISSWDGFHVDGGRETYQDDDRGDWDDLASLWLTDPRAAQQAIDERLTSPKVLRLKAQERERERERLERQEYQSVLRKTINTIRRATLRQLSDGELLQRVAWTAIISRTHTAAAIAQNVSEWTPVIQGIAHRKNVPVQFKPSKHKNPGTGKWGPILMMLRDTGGAVLPIPHGEPARQFANRLRAMLTCKITNDWRWSVRCSADAVYVVSLGKRDDHMDAIAV